jgi:DNA-binding response OmpR family regulator
MPKILAVDDEVAILSIIEKFLTKSGYEVIVKNNGKDAIDIISTSDDIDMIVLDIKMPGLTGIDVLKTMRKMKKNIPVAILSGSIGIQENVGVLNELGFEEEDVLYKPIDLFELLKRIKHTLKQE